jgi:hypothetical protein
MPIYLSATGTIPALGSGRRAVGGKQVWEQLVSCSPFRGFSFFLFLSLPSSPPFSERESRTIDIRRRLVLTLSFQ